MTAAWERTPRTSRAQGNSEPTPTPPRRGPDRAPLLGGVGVGRFMDRVGGGEISRFREGFSRVPQLQDF